MKKVLVSFIVLLALYGLGRVYYRVTDGFLIQNILFEHAPNPKYNVEISEKDLENVRQILSVPFYYLGKGCQSYVFEDASKTHVIKFIKYQRYRPYTTLDYFDFIPWVKSYTDKRRSHKLEKIDNLYTSWKTALTLVPTETGVIFVHLNKTPLFDKKLVVYDKIGIKHEIDLNTVEFLVQKRAQQIAPYLTNLIEQNKIQEAELFLRGMLDRTMDEFSRGISDNDYALLQNTGVLDDSAVHIDVGQIIYNPIVKTPEVYKKELFNKTYKFRVWLREQSVSLADSFDKMLVEIIGPEFYTMPPYVNKSDMGDIPNMLAIYTESDSKFGRQEE